MQGCQTSLWLAIYTLGTKSQNPVIPTLWKLKISWDSHCRLLKAAVLSTLTLTSTLDLASVYLFCSEFLKELRTQRNPIYDFVESWYSKLRVEFWMKNSVSFQDPPLITFRFNTGGSSGFAL